MTCGDTEFLKLLNELASLEDPEKVKDGIYIIEEMSEVIKEFAKKARDNSENSSFHTPTIMYELADVMVTILVYFKIVDVNPADIRHSICQKMYDATKRLKAGKDLR